MKLDKLSLSKRKVCTYKNIDREEHLQVPWKARLRCENGTPTSEKELEVDQYHVSEEHSEYEQEREKANRLKVIVESCLPM